MRFKKEHKDFVASVTAWATGQGWDFLKVDIGRLGICYHCFGAPGGVILGRAGKRDKEALFNLCAEIVARFPDDTAALAAPAEQKAIQ